MAYASNTNVSIEKSQIEIKEMLRRHGAGRVGIIEDDNQATVAFEYQKLLIQMSIKLPAKEKFRMSPNRRSRRTDNQMIKEWEQASRQKWRVLLLTIKAKLNGIAEGVTTLEHEFMAFIVMPNGVTFGDFAMPKLLEAAETGTMPLLGLPGGVQ
jgi:hypothetical protein